MKKIFNSAGLVAVIVMLAAAFLSCDMDADDTQKKIIPPGAPLLGESGADPASLSGTSVSFVFSSDRAGTYYALVQNAAAPAPSAEAVRSAVSADGKVAASGAMSAGRNTFAVSGLTAGADYTAFIAAADGAGILSEALPIAGIQPAVLAIIGSEWYMGAGRLTFKANGKAGIHGYEYTYTCDDTTHTGYVSGNVYGRNEVYDGKHHGDIINALGNFTVNSADDGRSLTFVNYRESGFPISFTKERQTVEADRLTGTHWSWPSLELEFLPNGKVLQFSTSGYYPHPHVYGSYTFDPKKTITDSANRVTEQEIGYIAIADSVCAYSTATTALGWFIIMHDFVPDGVQTAKAESVLYFPGPESRYHASVPFNRKGYKEYVHRADFMKRTDD